jgi:transcriptional regulator with GAF, ATPase, and Fis domain
MNKFQPTLSRVEELEGLHELTGVLSSEQDIDQMLASIIRIILNLCQARYASILLLNPATKETMKTLVHQPGDASGGMDHLLNMLLAGWVIEHKVPLRAKTIAAGVGIKQKGDRYADYGPVLSVPLLVGDEMIGVLNLVREPDSAEFTEDALRIAAIVAGQSARYIHQAKLVESVFEENRRLRLELEGKYNVRDIIARSAKMRELSDMIPLLAQTTATVLLSGETGTGKELFARAIHRGSNRAAKPFVALNCAAIPANLIESELFGHERGAFTGAASAVAGKFEIASGGTLFLDEISEMPIELQPKLLRVLEERKFYRLGSGVEKSADVRVIAASNRNLPELVRERKFRDDLYYRLSVMPVELPPLRERQEDIPLLAQHFLDGYSHRTQRFDESALGLLRYLEWKGNVRELRNVVERISLLIPAPVVTGDHLESARVLVARPATDDYSPDSFFRSLITAHAGRSDLLDEVESRLVRIALRESCGCATKAAKLLGIDRKALERRKEKFQL